MNEKPQFAVPWMQYIIIGIAMFGLTTLATLLVTHWNTFNTLVYESSLAKYEVMSGERGPTTYLISHNNYVFLQDMADTHDDILGVEQHEGSNVAKMAFASAQSPLIEEVRQLSVVTGMINRNVPMLCH